MARGEGAAARPPALRTSKHDAEVARQEVELAKVERQAEAVRVLAWCGGTAVIVAATALPIWLLQGVIEPLAGKQTVIEANILISVSLTISVAISVALGIKNYLQRAEIRRMRQRLDELEGKLLPTGEE